MSCIRPFATRRRTKISTQQDSTSSSAKFSWLREFIFVVICYTLLTIILTYPVARHLNTRFMGDDGDSFHNVWNMWLIKTSLLELHTSPYYTNYVFHPTGHSMLFQTLNPFNGLVSIPLQYFLRMETIYNLIALFSFVASGTAMYYLAKYLISNRLAAFVSGVIFTFCPYHFAHGLGHLQLMSMQWLPVYILFLIKILDQGRARHAVLAGLSLILISLCCWYYLLYAACLTLILIVARWRRLLQPRRLVHLGLACTVFLVVMSPLLGAMIYAKISDQSISGHDSRICSADLVSFFVPGGL